MDRRLYIDAGIEHINFSLYEAGKNTRYELLTDTIQIPNNDHIPNLLRMPAVNQLFKKARDEKSTVFITGKLADVVQQYLPLSEVILPAAALWSAAKFYLHQESNAQIESLGIIDLSASGYMLICIDAQGDLKNDSMIVNPRCGAGTGVNLTRVLEKLDINKDSVDHILFDYLGDRGHANRSQIPVRSDRCGVFSSSATISDKNQGIPLDHALAVTMKSEVAKSCDKMLPDADMVYLTGGVFRWQYARDCAEDILRTKGIADIRYDAKQSLFIDGLHYLARNISKEKIIERSAKRLRRPKTIISKPSFPLLHKKFQKSGLYHRIADPVIAEFSREKITETALCMGLDIGSTMAKAVISDSDTGNILFKSSCNNHGDTIETVQHIFRSISAKGISELNIQSIGLTGSGRYQVQKALKAIYPHLENNIYVLVENYAHVHGSIDLAKNHIQQLKKSGKTKINEDFCVLIDIGGEDTKISVIALKKDELFDNAMNVKCSAGTGSLMDTLSAMFGIHQVEEAYEGACQSPKAFEINATCAVFLMENSRKMQAEGYPKEEILASCCHAIIENMARSLWDQIDFPENTLVLLHGQTMLSDPLPLAVSHRIQEYTGHSTYCLVPPYPGHRACLGLIEAQKEQGFKPVKIKTDLNDLISYNFDKRVIICRGAVCGDINARCARTKLTSNGTSEKISLSLGGCTSVNEFQTSRKDVVADTPDAYGDIWRHIDQQMPKSQDENRLVIPRSFSISENAYLFAYIFTQLGLPVHVDNVCEKDILEGQPFFSIDTCAPNIGATGQFMRLAGEPHGIILVPQIEFLPIDGDALGRTCTTNQGGVQIAQHFAESIHPNARFHLFDINLEKNEANYLADQLFPKFERIFKYYHVMITKSEFIKIVSKALIGQEHLKETTADLAGKFIKTAIDKQLNISVISAREYILNPGIYDSHVGKLLKDKGIVAIPLYVFDAKTDAQFDFIYWKNPHTLLTKVNAIVNKKFHTVINNPNLIDLVRSIELGRTDSNLSVVTVSTFRCGPDSVTLPIQAELTKNKPTLLIQSDAMIAELAHLENRVNTHLNQLKNSLHSELNNSNQEKFTIEILNNLNLNGQSKDECVMYVPTMGDNRTLSAVFRAAGYTTIDNFEDATFDLEEKVKAGRKYLGDSVCVPLAGIFSDMIQAVTDFKRRKKLDDPVVKDKDKIILFMQSGDGPCRQGQYIDICKLAIYKHFSETNDTYPVRFLSNTTTALDTKKDFLSELENWASLQVYQIVIIKDVLHSIFLKFISRCQSYSEYEEFSAAYLKLKTRVYGQIENNMKPAGFYRSIVDFCERYIPQLAGISKYLLFGFYNNNGLRRLFRQFDKNWNKIITNGRSSGEDKIKIHVDGEIYLRLAQIEEILKLLIDLRGFNWFHLSYASMWSYFEYIVEQRIVLAGDHINKYRKKLNSVSAKAGQRELKDLISKETKKYKEAQSDSSILRNILARPLYKAAGVEMPDRTRDHIANARNIIPTLKPEGELIPYIGSTISEINQGADLVLNIAPEGCMVASMGEMMSSKISQVVDNNQSRIQYMSTTDGEINEDLLELALLKRLGPVNYYKSQN